MTGPLIDPRKPKELARECPMDIYLSGSDGAGAGKTYFPWAYRMNKVDENGLTPSYIEDCDIFILDSAINDPSVTTALVIRDARKYDPDYVVAADVLYEPEQTTERVHQLLDRLDDENIDAEPIVPLQPSEEGASDHDEHYRELEGTADYYALGGLRDVRENDVMRSAVEKVRAVAGDSVKLHGLGFGMGYLTDQRVHKEPLLDSMDCSTPIQEGRAGKMHLYHEGQYQRVVMDRPTSDMSLLAASMASGTTLISMAQVLLTTAPPVPVNHDLAEFGRAAAADGGFSIGEDSGKEVGR